MPEVPGPPKSMTPTSSSRDLWSLLLPITVGLAAVAVGFIKGCAVQSMIDPKNFDIEEFLTAMKGLMGQLAPGAAV